MGLAVAAKSLGAHYNKDDFPVIDPTIWCFTGDGCLQEGVGQEGELLLMVFGAFECGPSAVATTSDVVLLLDMRSL